MVTQISTFVSRTKLYHGFGSATLAGEEALSLGIKRALLVTDKGVRKAGLLQRVEESLGAKNISYDIFDDVPEDADVECIHQGTLRAREANCGGVIVVGGGSAICTGKGIALETTNGNKVRDYAGRNRYKVPPLPVICLPTTAGSGSDVSWTFVVHDSGLQKIYGVGGDHVQPQVSILDPELLRTCPPRQMINSGLDALSHAIEALWTSKGTPLTDCIAYEATRLIMGNLREAALTDSMDAKSAQHLASSMANLACGNASLGIVHGMTGYYGIKLPHGYFNGVLLPYAMEFNLPACEKKLAQLAIILGETPAGQSERGLARLALKRLKLLYLDLGFARKFESSEVPTANIPQAVKAAMESPVTHDNIRKVTEKDINAIYEKSLKGWELD